MRGAGGRRIARASEPAVHINRHVQRSDRVVDIHEARWVPGPLRDDDAILVITSPVCTLTVEALGRVVPPG